MPLPSVQMKVQKLQAAVEEVDEALRRRHAAFEELLQKYGRPQAPLPSAARRSHGSSTATPSMAVMLARVEAVPLQIDGWRDFEGALRALFSERDAAVEELQGQVASLKVRMLTSDAVRWSWR